MPIQKCHSCRQETTTAENLEGVGLFPKAVKGMDAGTWVLVERSWPPTDLEPGSFAVPWLQNRTGLVSWMQAFCPKSTMWRQYVVLSLCRWQPGLFGPDVHLPNDVLLGDFWLFCGPELWSFCICKASCLTLVDSWAIARLDDTVKLDSCLCSTFSWLPSLLSPVLSQYIWMIEKWYVM